LKITFGTATVPDVLVLHEVFNELQLSQTDIVHFISKQVTHKKMDAMTGLNSNATENLSSIVKDVVIHSHDKFKDFTRDVLWLNVTNP
jgi:hypothetical protein